jgi:hypothetical protein
MALASAKRWFKSGQTMLQVTGGGGAKTRRAALAEAEARSAASAQASFPARRAREKRGVEKENGTERNQSQTAREIRPLVIKSTEPRSLRLCSQVRTADLIRVRQGHVIAFFLPLG